MERRVSGSWEDALQGLDVCFLPRYGYEVRCVINTTT
jgi:hypothetical protein